MADVSLNNAGGPQSEPTKEKPTSVGLLPLVDEALKLGGFLYVLGFIVIMVHTSSLHTPVVEALQFQNILAGWPIGLGIWLVYKLWPWVRHAIRSAAVSWTGILILAGGLVLSVLIVRAELLAVARGLSIYVNVVLLSGIFFVANVFFLYLAYNQKHEGMKSLFRVTCVYSLVAFLVLGYAIFGYPNLSQTLGGGRPVQVRLYFESAALSALVGGSPPSAGQAVASDPVYLYYRTSSYLLLSRDRNSDQPLIQVPTDQVRAVVWLESRSKSYVW